MNYILLIAISIALTTGEVHTQQAPEKVKPKSSTVAYVPVHRRISSVFTGEAFVKTMMNAAQGVQKPEEVCKDFLRIRDYCVNSQDRAGNTALHVVAFSGGEHAKQIMNFLLEASSVNMILSNNAQKTPLQEAMRADNHTMFDILANHAPKCMTLKDIDQEKQYAQKYAKEFVHKIDDLYVKIAQRESQITQKPHINKYKLDEAKRIKEENEKRELMGIGDHETYCCGLLFKLKKVHPALNYTAPSSPTAKPQG